MPRSQNRSIGQSSDYTEALQKKRYRVLSEQHAGATHVYADKNRWAKMATFPFHLALILILIGGIVGARYGFRENEFIIPEGSVRDVGHGTGLSVKLDQFSDSWREDGTAASYRSDLVLYKNGEEVKSQSITVNNPMTYGTTTFYQTSYGQAAQIRVTDADGNILFDDSVDLGIYRSSANPDAPAGIINLPQVGVQLNVIAPDEDRANAPMLDTLNLQSGQMYIQMRETGPNASSELPGHGGQSGSATGAERSHRRVHSGKPLHPAAGCQQPGYSDFLDRSVPARRWPA